MLNRRSLLKGFALFAAALPAGSVLVGCTKAAQTTIAAILTTIGTGVSMGLTLAGLPGPAALASQWAQAAANAVANWVPGTPGQDVIQALNILTGNLLGLIPGLSGTVLAIVNNAVTTIEGLLADFGVTAATIATAAAAHATIQATATGKYPSQATLDAALADFKKAHNALCASDPAFASAKI
jgi:hypothetical protein